MRALRSFTVRARLPEALGPLQELAFNLRWSWDHRTRDLFRWVDPQIWELTFHDPVRLLSLVGRQRLDQLAADPAFMGFLGEMHDDLQPVPRSAPVVPEPDRSPLHGVAYFSPEFGIAEALPQYSGGLGVLAGDHLKAASSLGIPLTGVGLMYRLGYFRQHLDTDGWQEERYPVLDPHSMALELVDGVRITVDLAGAPRGPGVAGPGRPGGAVPARRGCGRQRGRASERHRPSLRRRGRAPDPAGDPPRHRRGAGPQAAGVEAQVFHTNEGHAGFLGLERIRKLITTEGLRWDEAIEAARAGDRLHHPHPRAGRHRPLPPGADGTVFHRLGGRVRGLIDTLMSLGHFPGESRPAVQHGGDGPPPGGQVQRGVWAARPDQPGDVPGLLAARARRGNTDRSITNGVHGRTWVSSQMDDLYSKYVSPAWDEAGAEEWAGIDDARDDELWRAREQGRDAW